LARLEMEVALQTLFKRMPKMQLSGIPVYRDTYHFHGLEKLGVVVNSSQNDLQVI
jgi:cytochrome P450